MGNLLDRFKQNVQGSNLKDFDYLPKITAAGDMKRTSGINTVINSWHTLLQIPIGSYDHDPLLGTNVPLYVFEPADEITKQKIKSEIEYRLPKYDDRASIENVNVSFLQSKKGFNVIIELTYQGEKANLETTITESNVSKFLGG